MTDATYTPKGYTHKGRAQPRADSLPLPKPVPFAAPVLIGDCATPLAGETVLSLLWKRLKGGDQAE